MDQLPPSLRAPLTALQVAYPQPTNLPNVNVTALYPILENGFAKEELDEEIGKNEDLTEQLENTEEELAKLLEQLGGG